MSNLSDLFWKASVDELKQGYVYQSSTEEFICLICGQTYTKGIIYSDNNHFYEAEKFLQTHIKNEHVSMFEFLLGLDKKMTGLTEHQKSLLRYFYNDFSDAEIVKEQGGGSTSTIRNHRFALREKEKQAKIFLAIMGLLETKPIKVDNFIGIHRSATMLDERYAITEQENEKILKAYFKEGLQGPLSDFPTKQKRKLAILKHISNRFEANKEYSEKEVNKILQGIYHDYVTLRRYLIEYGFLDRYDDGSFYWLKL